MHPRSPAVLAALVLAVAASTVVLGSAGGQSAGPAARPAQAAGVVPAKKSAATPAQKPAAQPELPENVFTADVPAKNAPADPQKQQRLQKINGLAFDRRPSAILRAWSTPRDEAIKEPDSIPIGGAIRYSTFVGADAPPGRGLRSGS